MVQTLAPISVPPRHALARERVRHVGDPVAFVVAEDYNTALDALELIEVDYTDLPAIAAGPVPASVHARVLQTTEALHHIEMGPPSAPLAAPADSLRIAFWNAERCKYLDDSADLLARAEAGVTLLSEMDLGMARSG